MKMGIALWFSVFCLIPSGAHAGGAGVGNGGDPVLARQLEIQAGLTLTSGRLPDGSKNPRPSRLALAQWEPLVDEAIYGLYEILTSPAEKQEVFYESTHYDVEIPLDLRNPVVEGALRKIFFDENNRFKREWNDPIRFSDHCVDLAGKDKAMTAKMNEAGGEICVNLAKLATENASDAEIEALLIHEMAHHMGYADEDYAMYRFGLFAAKWAISTRPWVATSFAAAHSSLPLVPGVFHALASEPLCQHDIEYDAQSDQLVDTLVGDKCGRVGAVYYFQCGPGTQTCHQVGSKFRECRELGEVRVLTDGNYILSAPGCLDTKFVRN